MAAPDGGTSPSCCRRRRRTVATDEESPKAPEAPPALLPANTPDDVLRFWFRGAHPDKRHLLDDEGYISRNLPRWMAAQENMDAEAQAVATDIIRKLGREAFEDEAERSLWWGTKAGLVAQLLCLDQLSRNCFRRRAEAFAYDGVALRVARQILDGAGGDVEKLLDAHPAAECMFLLIAFQHSEDMELHNTEFRIIDAASARHPSCEKIWEQCREHGGSHLEVLRRFGRYPHRNAQQGRESTEEERAWLADTDKLPAWARSQVQTVADVGKS